MSDCTLPSTEKPPIPWKRKKRDPQARPDPADLRKRSLGARDAALLCVQRARLLPLADRAALTAVFRDGMRVKELAALHPDARQKERARSLRRYLRRTSARLLSRKFEFVIHFLEPADQAERRRLGLPCWPPKRRAVAEECIVHGRSIREAARALGTTFHAVRKELNAIHAVFDAAQKKGPTP